VRDRCFFFFYPPRAQKSYVDAAQQLVRKEVGGLMRCEQDKRRRNHSLWVQFRWAANRPRQIVRGELRTRSSSQGSSHWTQHSKALLAKEKRDYTDPNADIERRGQTDLSTQKKSFPHGPISIALTFTGDQNEWFSSRCYLCSGAPSPFWTTVKDSL